MRQEDAATEWLRCAGALTVPLPGAEAGSPSSEPRAVVAELQALALALNCTGAPHARCGVAGHGGADALCALAADLRRCAPSLPPAAVGGDLGPRFLTALEGAAAAVYLCRRVAHPSGTCWFSTAVTDDLCGRVLAATHTAAA